MVNESILGVPAPRVLRTDDDGREVLDVSDEDHAWLLSSDGLDLMERVILESAGRIPRQSYGVTGTQEEREAEVRRREIILVTRRSNHAHRHHASGATVQNVQNETAAPVRRRVIILVPRRRNHSAEQHAPDTTVQNVQNEPAAEDIKLES